MRKGSVGDAIGSPWTVMVHLGNTSAGVSDSIGRRKEIQGILLANFTVMSPGWLGSVTLLTPSCRVWLLLLFGGLPHFGYCAWVNEACLKIAYPDAADKSVEGVQLLAFERPWIDETEQDLGSICKRCDEHTDSGDRERGKTHFCYSAPITGSGGRESVEAHAL